MKVIDLAWIGFAVGAVYMLWLGWYMCRDEKIGKTDRKRR